jgi:hypothetical protein
LNNSLEVTINGYLPGEFKSDSKHGLKTGRMIFKTSSDKGAIDPGNAALIFTPVRRYSDMR